MHRVIHNLCTLYRDNSVNRLELYFMLIEAVVAI